MARPMLYPGPMRSLLVATALVAASATAASANTYLGLGIGTAASPGGDTMSSDGNRSGRLMLGTRFGHLSIEGAGSRYSLFNGPVPYDGTMLAGALKYSLPLGNNFEVFGRGGIERTWLTSASSTAGNAYEWSGNGWLLGAGFEYRLDLGVTAASIFVDYEHSSTTLTTPAEMNVQRDEAIGLWTAGVTLAL